MLDFDPLSSSEVIHQPGVKNPKCSVKVQWSL